MIDYKELERITFENVNEGQSVSLPLLESVKGVIVARFLVYSVNRCSGEVGVPFRCFEIRLDSGVSSEIDPSSVASGAEAPMGSLVGIPGYQDGISHIPELFQNAVKAMESGTDINPIREYAAAVLELTQPCLHSYCKALAPSLFSK